MNKIILPLGLLLSASAHSETYDYLKCRVSGGSAKAACVLEKPAELRNFKDGFLADFKIKYSFACEGHATGLVFAAGSDIEDLRYTKPGQVATLLVSGTHSLSFYDANPQKTAAATIKGPCALTIQSVSVTPNIETIESWNELADTQAKLINASNDLYALASNLTDYISWDTAQTEIMLESVNLRIEMLTSQCDEGVASACQSLPAFKVIRGALTAKVEGAPQPQFPSGATFETVKESYRSNLRLEVEKGSDMIERFGTWKLAIHKELQAVIDSIESI